MSAARKFLGQALSFALLGLVIAGGLALIIVPKATGARPLTILSGSMTGTYDVGDVVVVKPVKTADLKIGDVITFQPFTDDPQLTTHRIVGMSFGITGESSSPRATRTKPLTSRRSRPTRSGARSGTRCRRSGTSRSGSRATSCGR